MKPLIFLSFLAFLWSCGDSSKTNIQSQIIAQPSNSEDIVASLGVDIDGDGQKNDTIFVEKSDTIILSSDTAITFNYYFYKNRILVQHIKDTLFSEYDGASISIGIDTNTIENFITIRIGLADCETDFRDNNLFYWDKNGCTRLIKYTNEVISDQNYSDVYFSLKTYQPNKILFTSYKQNCTEYNRPTSDYMDWFKVTKQDSIQYQFNGTQWTITPITPKGAIFYDKVLKYDELYPVE